MVCCEIRTVPHFGLADFIEPNVVICDLEWAESVMKLVETSQRFAEHIEGLAMVQVLGVGESMGDVLGVDDDFLGSSAPALGFAILGIVDLDDGLVGEVAIVVHFHLILLGDRRIVEDNMIFRMQA